MLLNCGIGEDSWESLGLQPVHFKGDQSWVFFGRNDAKAEAPVLWPPHAKSWLIGKDSDAGRDWGQEEKGTTEDEMNGWHHRVDGHEFEWTPGVGDGQGGLACCNSWGRKESDTTEQLNWTEDTARPAHRTKDWAEEASCGMAHHLPETGRRGQPEPERVNCSPREASYTKLQADFIANQDFLGFWMVDICREGHSQRSAPQKRHMAHLGRHSRCTPRKPSSWDRGGHKSQPSTRGDSACQSPGHLSCSDLGQAQKAGTAKSAPLLSAREPEPEQLRLGECMQPKACVTVPGRAT